jgi:selenide,water dikinase
MSQLNRFAAEAAAQSGAHALTDITGFGFLGHASEIANASGVTLQIEAHKIPLLDGVQGYAKEWIFPGGSADNQRIYENEVKFDNKISEEMQMLFFDAQTSGGLLIALPPNFLEDFAAKMRQHNAAWWQIGQVIERQAKSIFIIP